MKRFLTLCMALVLFVGLAVPALAVELESSVTSGDTITDTYSFKCETLSYQSTFGSGQVASNTFSETLPEGDYIYFEAYYEGLDLTDIISSDYITTSAVAKIEFSIIGGVSYECAVVFGDGTGYFPPRADVEGEIYDSNEVRTITVELDLTDAEYINPEVYLDIYSYSSNFYVEFHDIEISIVRKRIDKYVPDYTVPGDGIGEELDDLEKDALDQVDDGKQAFEDVQVGVLDTLALYATSFLAVGVLLDTFLEINFIDNLLVVSLAVGSFALLLGLVLSFTRRK